jgi:hypothetical protein
MEEHCAIYREELLEIALHPSRIRKYVEEGYEREYIFDF